MGITIQSNLFGEYVAYVEEQRMKQASVHRSKKRQIAEKGSDKIRRNKATSV